MTSGRLKRSRVAATNDLVYVGGSTALDYESTSSRNEQFESDSLSAPPLKKFLSSSDITSLPTHVNDLAAYAAFLASSSANQSNSDQVLQNSLLTLVSESPPSQLAILAQKQQQHQRHAVLTPVPHCLIPGAQHTNLFVNPQHSLATQLRPANLAQTPFFNSYGAGACPLVVQNTIPYQTQLPPVYPAAKYYEGSPLIMVSNSHPSSFRLNNADSLECKVVPNLYYNVFVGDLSPEVDNVMLMKAFEKYGPLIEAKVMIDQSSGKSRGFGFVTYWKQEDATKAIGEMNGQMVGKRPVRTNWAMRQKGETRIATYEEILKAGDGSNASVYLKNVGEATETDIRESFDKYGTIKQIRLFSSKNYGFVVYETKENAARAILEMSGQKIKGHVINCSWGRVQEQTSKINNFNAIAGLNAANIVAQLPFPTLLPQIYQPNAFWHV